MTKDSEYIEFSFGISGAPGAILSTLTAGDMKREEEGSPNPRRRRLYGTLGIDPGRVLSLPLGHTRRIVVLEDAVRRDSGTLREALRADLEAYGPADGIILHPNCSMPDLSSGPGALSLPDSLPAVTVADCMPIWLYDAGSGAFGVLHSGWKGTGILEVAVRTMIKRFGAEPSGIAAILGPSIGACCYEVPEERAMVFEKEFGRDSVVRRERPDGMLSFRLDLGAANLGLASRLCLGTVIDARRCTACSADLGSYRRQGSTSFTRMLALCGYFTPRADIFTEM